MDFVPGQRWYSLTEPELGLGIVASVEGRQVVLAFPVRDVVRRYAADSPLVRGRLNPGQEARGRDGLSFRVEEVDENGGLLTYHGGERSLDEAELDSTLDVATPENRLLGGQTDEFGLFDLRHAALAARHRMLASPVRGLLGGRIRLFDHQLSIAHHLCQRHRIRVLLADEVGLGKTIEALLTVHRLLLAGRIENALVLVPPALVHQWLAEAYLRFNLVFNVMGSDTHGGGTVDLQSEDLPEQLLSAQLFICPLGTDTGEAFEEASWDIVVVDEAHRLEPESPDFARVARLAARTEHVIFLSATPDRHGEQAHFRRLTLLDPARYHDWETYRRQGNDYRRLAATAQRLQGDAPLAPEDLALLQERFPDDAPPALPPIAQRRRLLARLLDLHGPGRVMFRNVRARIPGFPRRVLRQVRLEGGDPARWHREFLADSGCDPTFRFVGADKDPRTAWLRTFLENHPDDKVLVLCSDRAKVEAFARALEDLRHRVARFHEAMGNVERDRQAAWFLDDEGPQTVISSAIGAEGRNFQVARHLVLLDLPPGADRLEQAIGRLDRIGQGAEIHIHPLAPAGTPQARLCRWYDEALGVFERPWHGSPALEREFGDELAAALLSPGESAIEDLIERGRVRNSEIIAQLEEGRDRLLELNSFDAETAADLRRQINDAENDPELERFMVDAFERGGLDVEVIGERSHAVRAGFDYHRPFPGFVGEEMAFTFDRDTALLHPERVLLTWDHPMVRDTLDALLEHSTGNAGIARLPGADPGLYLEALYVAEPTLAQNLRADRFMPPTPIRVAVDAAGAEADIAGAADRLEAADPALLAAPQINDALPGLVRGTRALANDRLVQLADEARQRMRKVLEPAATRLAELARVNPAVSPEEVEAARTELNTLDQGLGKVRLRLDGLRLVLAG